MLRFLREKKADALHRKAMNFSEKGDDKRALSYYMQALKIDPKRSTTLYNIGLIYKYEGNWQKSLEFSKAAFSINSQDEAAAWNWGIAASALEQWSEARTAWRSYGISGIDEGDEPLECNYGRTPIRLHDSDGNAEVVWAKRLDPARACIMNIPTLTHMYSYEDIVLHDGAPNGSRISNGKEYDVFDSLAILRKSQYMTYEIRLLAPDEESLNCFQKNFENIDLFTQNWTECVRKVCACCSNGTLDQDKHLPVWQNEHSIAVASKSRRDLEHILQTMQASEVKILEIDGITPKEWLCPQ